MPKQITGEVLSQPHCGDFATLSSLSSAVPTSGAPKASEQDLIASAKAGDRDSFEVLFSRCRPQLLAGIKKVVPYDWVEDQDILNETLKSAMDSHRTISRKK